MAPHSSTLAWKIPWMEEPGRLQSMGSQRVGWTRLSDFTFTFHFHALEKEMATHSSILAWRIPGMGELGGLPSMGSHAQSQTWLKRLSSSSLSPRWIAWLFLKTLLNTDSATQVACTLWLLFLEHMSFTFALEGKKKWNTTWDVFKAQCLETSCIVSINMPFPRCSSVVGT